MDKLIDETACFWTSTYLNRRAIVAAQVRLRLSKRNTWPLYDRNVTLLKSESSTINRARGGQDFTHRGTTPSQVTTNKKIESYQKADLSLLGQKDSQTRSSTNSVVVASKTNEAQAKRKGHEVYHKGAVGNVSTLRL